jgi:1-acyl-sn-glycerol-3-phosphate acyltransferase
VQLPSDATRLWKAIYLFVALLRPLFFRIKVEGAAHVPPAGGCIITCNHTYGPDFIALGFAMPRQIYYMAKMEIFAWNPLLAKFFANAGVFPVKRGQGDLSAFHTAVGITQGGKVLGMFPEGTRSRTGQLMRGKTGAARIAMSAQRPVVPVVVINAPQVFKRCWRPGPRAEVTVRFGPPIQPQGSPDDPVAVRECTDQIMRGMAALLPVELQGDYGKVTESRTPPAV